MPLVVAAVQRVALLDVQSSGTRQGILLQALAMLQLQLVAIPLIGGGVQPLAEVSTTEGTTGFSFLFSEFVC